MGRVVSRESCPQCGSTDNVARYEDGGYYCYTPDCTYAGKGDQGYVPQVKSIKVMNASELRGVVEDIPNRRLSKATCQKFGVTVEYGSDGKISKHHYPTYSMEGELIGTKTRVVLADKKRDDYYSKGNLSGETLFGQHTCRGNGKFITITEGELDALSVSEMFDRKWDVVSLKKGAATAVQEIKASLEFLESYDKVVLCFDNDVAGKKATSAVRDLFSPEKILICKLPMKDASDMLQANRIAEFTKAWWASKPYRPDGIVAGNDTWEAITENRSKPSVLYPWQGLNSMTRGYRLGELVTITSGSGMGKSQMIRELEYHMLQATDSNIGVIALEEDIARTALGIMSVHANRPLHLDEGVSHDELRPHWEATLGTNRYFLYDHFGSTGLDNLLSRVRFMVKSLDCDRIVLDHLSIVVSSQENGDERKAIDEVMTKLRTLVQELGISMFLVSHLKRAGGQAHEDGGRISLSELRGSQSIAQLSDIVIGLERDQQNPDPIVRNTSTVRVLKNRYTGQTGPACYLQYDVNTGRMNEVEAPQEDLNEDDF